MQLEPWVIRLIGAAAMAAAWIIYFYGPARRQAASRSRKQISGYGLRGQWRPPRPSARPHSLSVTSPADSSARPGGRPTWRPPRPSARPSVSAKSETPTPRAEQRKNWPSNRASHAYLMAKLDILTRDQECSNRLVSTIQEKFPDQDKTWCVQKAIGDLIRDRNRR